MQTCSESNNSTSSSSSESPRPTKPDPDLRLFSFVQLQNSLGSRNPYTRHSIPDQIRLRMLDWMIEVLYKCSSSTYSFFLSVDYLDRFFQSSASVLSKQDIHIAGITAMSLAGKFEDSAYMTLEVIQKEVAHKKFSLDQLEKMERTMLIALKFELKHFLSIDILRYVAWLLMLDEKILKIAELVLLLARFELYLQFSPFEEAVACLFIACRSEGCSEYADRVQRVLESCDENLDYTVICIQNKMCEYKIEKPGFKSPMTYFGFEFESIDKKSLFRFKSI